MHKKIYPWAEIPKYTEWLCSNYKWREVSSHEDVGHSRNENTRVGKAAESRLRARFACWNKSWRDNWCASYPGIELTTLCSSTYLAVIFLPFILGVLSSRSVLSPRKRNSQIFATLYRHLLPFLNSFLLILFLNEDKTPLISHFISPRI